MHTDQIMEGKVFTKLDTFAMLLPLPTTKHSFVFIMQYACLIESPSVPNKQISYKITNRKGFCDYVFSMNEWMNKWIFVCLIWVRLMGKMSGP